MKLIRRTGALLTGACALAAMSSTAWASSPIEFPDNGVAAFSRGGAWLATATDPIAGYYNPAALSMQPTSLGVGANFAFQKICFARRGTNDSIIGPTQSAPAYPEVCNANSGKPELVPNLAFTWRVNKQLGVGLTVTPPAAYGALEWDPTAPTRTQFGTTQELAAPQRYQSLGVKATVLWPTLAAGYSITDKLHVGAGFVAGIAILDLQSASMSQASDPENPSTDTHSELKAKDLFVPGFVLSGLYEVTDNIDIAGWYRWSDKIRAKGDLEVQANYYGPGGALGSNPTLTRSADKVGKDAASVTIGVPMEARIGARWHLGRRGAHAVADNSKPTRDPLRDDMYDTELDLTWSNNSSSQAVEVRFPFEGIPVDTGGGSSLGFVPANADVPTGYRDTFGARLGGQWNAIQSKLGVRLGAWIESSANDASYLTVTGVPATRAGFGGGVVFRIGMVDVEAGYQHHVNAGFDNKGNGSIHAVAATNAPTTFRSAQAINGGKVTQSANVFALGGVIRF